MSFYANAAFTAVEGWFNSHRYRTYLPIYCLLYTIISPYFPPNIYPPFSRRVERKKISLSLLNFLKIFVKQLKRRFGQAYIVAIPVLPRSISPSQVSSTKGGEEEGGVAAVLSALVPSPAAFPFTPLPWSRPPVSFVSSPTFVCTCQ